MNAPCGVDSAMYIVGMDPSGGRSKLNPWGAQFGTGYCDSQCYEKYNFVNGVANPHYDRGACCNELDLWEANSRSNQLTAHPCNITGFYTCHGNQCQLGDHGPCDRTGCGFNPYGLGDHDFYGDKKKVDTARKFQVVTQFPTHDGTIHGELAEIRRLYVQDGKVIQNAAIKLKGKTFDSINPEFCESTVPNSYRHHGGLSQMGKALQKGMVLVMGIWNDPYDHNRWLDSGSAGPCSRKTGSPGELRKNHVNTSVTFSNIRSGEIGSTYNC